MWSKIRFMAFFFFLLAFRIVPVCLYSAKLFKVSLVSNFFRWGLASTSVHDFRISFLSFSNLFYPVSPPSTVSLAGLCIACAQQPDTGQEQHVNGCCIPHFIGGAPVTTQGLLWWGELGPPSVASSLLGKRRDKPRQGGNTVK